jgi:YggT family protein
MPRNIADAITFIVQAIANLYLLVLLLRLWLPVLRADFRNPLAQAILKITSPLVIPLRRIMPSLGRVDTATILVAFVIQYLTILLILLIYGQPSSFAPIAITAVVNLVFLSLRLFAFAIVIRVILSWISPGGHNPATAIISTLTEPVLGPFRRWIPPIGGLDVSPIFAMILLFALSIVVHGFKPIGL